MKTKTYKVTGKAGANLRALPSASSKLEVSLKTGEKVEIIADFYSKNGETKYLCVYYKNHYYWAAAGNFSEVKESAKKATTEAKKSTVVEKKKTATQTKKPTITEKKTSNQIKKSVAATNVKKTSTETKKAAPKKVDYRVKVAEAAAKVYPEATGKKHGGVAASLVKDLASMKKYKALTCNRIASISMQQAGILPKGKIVSHTAKHSGKKKIPDAVKNTKFLKHCDVVWVNKLYKDLPDKYKKAGCVYYQDSNACISAGNGRIWSCNKSVGHKYTKGEYYRNSGYPFKSKILVVVVPRTE